jgi:hypothetical protein
MPARVFVFVYAALELVLGVTTSQSEVAVGGFLMLRYWRSADLAAEVLMPKMVIVSVCARDMPAPREPNPSLRNAPPETP